MDHAAAPRPGTQTPAPAGLGCRMRAAAAARAASRAALHVLPQLGQQPGPARRAARILRDPRHAPLLLHAALSQQHRTCQSQRCAASLVSHHEHVRHRCCAYSMRPLCEFACSEAAVCLSAWTSPVCLRHLALLPCSQTSTAMLYHLHQAASCTTIVPASFPRLDGKPAETRAKGEMHHSDERISASEPAAPAQVSTQPNSAQAARALSCSKDGRSLGLRAQHSRMMAASGAGQLAGMTGRRPFCTTPTAACARHAQSHKHQVGLLG